MEFRRNGLYFEEFNVGDRFKTLGRTITETDIVNFMGVSGIFEELYQNIEYVYNRSMFKARLVSGPCTIAVSEGLAVQLGFLHDTAMALLEIKSIVFPNPVFCNDTITVDITCVEKRESATKPDRGIITFDHVVTKQTGEVVLKMQKVRLIRRLPQALA